MVERLAWDQEAAGSIPAIPTKSSGASGLLVKCDARPARNALSKSPGSRPAQAGARKWQGLRIRYSTTCPLEMIMAGPAERRAPVPLC